MPLLHLPPELLTLIVEHIGAPELRKSVAYLLVAKRWYHVVLPIYLSHIPLSDLYLASHHDLERLPPRDTALSSLIRAKAKRLSVRLIGYPSKLCSVAPWYDRNNFYWRGQDGFKHFNDLRCDWTTAGPVLAAPVRLAAPTRWHWHREEQKLHQWEQSINEKLVDLADILSSSSSLSEFSLEASSTEYRELGPRWDYLHDVTIRSLVSSLPSSLNNLMLDMCGSRAVTPDYDRKQIHLCPLIAKRLRDFQNVRLRMRCICSEVLDTSSAIPNIESRLKTLVIKLSLPNFPEAFNEVYDGYTEFDAKSCAVTAIPLHKWMIAAGRDLAKKSPGLSIMRIVYRSQSDIDHRSSYELAVADCVRERYMFEPLGVQCYEDGGSRWEAWEYNESLQDRGSFEELMW